MIKELEGKVAVVTGAASGIGLSMAHAFAKRKMKLVVADINEEALNKAAESLNNSDAEVLAVAIDTGDPKQIESLATRSYERFGNVNVLCNNAGVGGGGPAHLLEPENWNWTFGPNLFGVIYGTRYFLGRMLESKEPCHIINTASIAGHLAGEMGPYSASKFAVVAISECIALECFNTNVGVSVLCPGLVDTKIMENSLLLSTNLTNVYQPSAAEIAAGQTFQDNFAKLLSLGMSPDLVAEMVIYAIQNDLFFIMTHPDYVNLIEDRFNRIKNDAAVISEKFPITVGEGKENSYEYKNESLVFSISYPDHLIQIKPPPNTPQVFAASREFLQDLHVSVADIPPNLRLEDTSQAFANLLIPFGKEVKIVSDKQITLQDGTVAQEAEITYKRFNTVSMASHHVSVIKDNKWIRVSTFAHPSFHNEELKKIGLSLKFQK
ncbi:MAG: SDR family NAD(P)-dependent oxidoreductase [Promethearchaeota archaeon]|jgi:NAD(P)-dependent dehydrogenase (short-subunit alcohol dehydrogenase family)